MLYRDNIVIFFTSKDELATMGALFVFGSGLGFLFQDG